MLLSVRAQRAFKWFAVAVALLALAVFLIVALQRHGPIVLESMAQTNIDGRTFRMVTVSNGTEQLHSFVIWSEWTVNGVNWQRETLESKQFSLTPHAAFSGPVPMPTNGRPRITVQVAPIDTSDFRYWRDRVVMLMGKNPSLAYKMYVEPK